MDSSVIYKMVGDGIVAVLTIQVINHVFRLMHAWLVGQQKNASEDNENTKGMVGVLNEVLTRLDSSITELRKVVGNMAELIDPDLGDKLDRIEKKLDAMPDAIRTIINQREVTTTVAVTETSAPPKGQADESETKVEGEK